VANLQKYKDDLEKLIGKGELLLYSLANEVGVGVEVVVNGVTNKIEFKKYLARKGLTIPDFKSEYETWYSEALEVIKQILPNRYEDFRRLYKDERRKDINSLTYTMSDYMVGLKVTRGWGNSDVAGQKSALPKFQQQMAILKSAERRFESSLFEIKQLLQADLFDSEIDTARELLKNGYVRAAGAVAGVVLEKHLEQVCLSQSVVIKKKKPTISDYNEALKANKIIEIPTWRFIQSLADLRNLCDHKRTREPKLEEIEDLINGVDKVSKTIF